VTKIFPQTDFFRTCQEAKITRGHFLSVFGVVKIEKISKVCDLWKENRGSLRISEIKLK